MRRRDPLSNVEPLIQRVYAYAAYRLGDGADAEDATSDVFERALRYRNSYDESRGSPEQWLIGIARRCVDDALSSRRQIAAAPPDEIPVPAGDHQDEVVRRIGVTAAIEALDDRARELLALRYGADLSARQIGELLGMKTNAVEVALHRTIARLREQLAEPRSHAYGTSAETSPRTSV